MNTQLRARRLRALLRLCIGLAGLGSALVAGLPAYAGSTICRTDPIVTLSNGVVVTMTADIASDPSLVQLVTYTLYAPQGVTIDHIEYIGDVPAEREQVVLVADRNDDHYRSQTRVRIATTDKIGVTASLGVGEMVASKDGKANADINLNLNTR